MTAPHSRTMPYLSEGAGLTLQGRYMVAAFVFVSALVSYRIFNDAVVPGQPQLEHFGLADFRDAVYYPVVALVDGNNPYSVPPYMRTYPVGLPFPLYSPITLLLHLPFGLVDFRIGAVIFHVMNVALTPVLAWLTLLLCRVTATAGRIFFLATLIVVSRCGFVNLSLGQSTTYVVIATYAALYFAHTRPWIAGLGLAVSTLKPNYGVPLAALMLARGDWRPTIIGVALAVAGAAAPTAILAYNAGGVRPFLTSLQESQRGFDVNPDVNPASSPLRVDIPALLSRPIGSPLGAPAESAVSLLVLALGAAGVRRLAATNRDPTGQLSAGLVCLTILVCMYHQVYDLMVLALPLTALAANNWAPDGTNFPTLRWTLLALLGLPMVNYLLSPTVLKAVGLGLHMPMNTGWLLALASFNGAAVFLAFAVYVAFALRPRPSGVADCVRC